MVPLLPAETRVTNSRLGGVTELNLKSRSGSRSDMDFRVSFRGICIHASRPTPRLIRSIRFQTCGRCGHLLDTSVPQRCIMVHAGCMNGTRSCAPEKRSRDHLRERSSMSTMIANEHASLRYARGGSSEVASNLWRDAQCRLSRWRNQRTGRIASSAILLD
jgi:hypothetical protein